VAPDSDRPLVGIRVIDHADENGEMCESEVIRAEVSKLIADGVLEDSEGQRY